MDAQKTSIFLIGLVVSTIASSSVYSSQLGPDVSQSRDAPSMQLQQVPAAVKHKTVYSIFSSGNPLSTLSAGVTTPIDAPTAVSCTSVGGCTIGFDIVVGVFSSVNLNQWSVCFQVDGNLIFPGCTMLRDTNVGNAISPQIQHYAVAQGTHTVQSFVWMNLGGSLSNWEVHYTVYKP